MAWIKNRPHLDRSCDEVDAAVFSGDVLFDDIDRAGLRKYVERWLRAINEHEAVLESDGW